MSGDKLILTIRSIDRTNYEEVEIYFLSLLENIQDIFHYKDEGVYINEQGEFIHQDELNGITQENTNHFFNLLIDKTHQKILLETLGEEIARDYSFLQLP